MSNRVKAAFGPVITHLWTLVRTPLATVPLAVRGGPFWLPRLKLDGPQWRTRPG
jgi:hypothetical protein